MIRAIWRTALLAVSMSVAPSVQAGDRLLASGGLMQLEGSAGGGLTPWALIAGLGTDRQIGASGFCTRVEPQDFRLDSCGAAMGIRNRLEASFAKQKFDLGTTVPGHSIGLRVVGIKLRLVGDAILDQDRWLPQIAVGAQWKHNEDFDLVPRLLGARSADGTDVYIAATKGWLAGPFGRTWVADLTLRNTRGNQMGILGFGGDRGNDHLMAEGSVGVFLSDNLVLGGEYRQKPDNLSAFREDDFSDAFLAWIPLKNVSLTLAYAHLGNIADKASQHGPYLSLQGSW